jgi:hypothetical protein
VSKLGHLVCRSELPGKFWNVVLEKDGDHLDQSCEKRGKYCIESRREGMSYVQ